MNTYGIYFTLDGVVVGLPINPEELPVVRSNDNTDYNVLGIGNITIPRTPAQKEVTISGYFPAKSGGLVSDKNFHSPEYYINFFEGAMNNKKVLAYTPVRYMEDGTAFDTSDAGFQCLIQSFTTTEKGGETGDFYYELSIREYRDYTPNKVTVKTTTATTTAVSVTETPTRDVPSDQMVVGSTVTVNGKYYASSYGDKPFGTASNKRCKVSRIVTGRSYPYHITTESGGALGWVKKDQMQVVKNV